MQSALTESGIAKVDKKTGKVRLKKLGLVKAAVRPEKTVRRAIRGISGTGSAAPPESPSG